MGKQERRQSILDAALRAFASRGYHQTHVSDIIAEAQIARGTFYLHFDGKKAVFEELVERLLVELRGSVRGVRIGDQTPSMEAQLQLIVRGVLSVIVENPLLTRIIVREAVAVDSDIDTRIRAFYSNLLDYIRDAVERGKRLNLLRDIDATVASMCIVGTIRQFMELTLWPNEDGLDVGEMATALLDFNLRGLLMKSA